MSKFVELLGDELGKQVEEKLGEGYFIGKTENYVAKHRFDEVNTQVNDLKTQVEDRDKQINDIKGKVKDNEELTNTIKQLQEENKQKDEEYQSQLAQKDFNYALDNALRDAEAKNPKAVKALLDTDVIKLSDNGLTGLKEQLDNLRESDSYLFGKETTPDSGGEDFAGGSGGGGRDLSDMTMEDYIKAREG